jgi:ribonuclease HII
VRVPEIVHHSASTAPDPIAIPAVPITRKKKPKRVRKPSPQRLRKLLATEFGFWSSGVLHVAGIDEVGRGPLAGPVVAAAVILPEGCWMRGVDDSKKLTAEKRQELYGQIVASCVCWGVGAASAAEIDRINIRRATALAMQRAIRRLSCPPAHLLVDGLAVPELGLEAQTAIVDGDAKVHSIAAASIIAKVTRDRLMERLALRHPAYGWERNKGYGTPEHLEALDLHGPTKHHRQSFQPCQYTFDDLLSIAELAADAL